MEQAAAVRPGSQIRVLTSGDVAFEAMLTAISAAQKEIHLEVYSFRADRIGTRFIEALQAAAKRGVAVRVVLDGWGTDDAAGVVAVLRRAGVNASVYNPLRDGLRGRLQRDHRKLLVVDDRASFIGGINITDEFTGSGGWADLALELRGEAARTLAAQLRRRRETANLSDLRIVLSSGGARTVQRRYMGAIRNARRRVVMAQSYFLPERGVLRTIRAAAQRGVEVILLLPARSDVPLTHALTQLSYRGLQRAGVKIHEWNRSILHAKAAVIDGEVALVGSFNFDPWSFVNLEVLAEVHRQDIAAEIESWIQERVGQSPLAAPSTRSRIRTPLERAGLRFLGLSWRISRAVGKWTRGQAK